MQPSGLSILKRPSCGVEHREGPARGQRVALRALLHRPVPLRRPALLERPRARRRRRAGVSTPAWRGRRPRARAPFSWIRHLWDAGSQVGSVEEIHERAEVLLIGGSQSGDIARSHVSLPGEIALPPCKSGRASRNEECIGQESRRPCRFRWGRGGFPSADDAGAPRSLSRERCRSPTSIQHCRRGFSMPRECAPRGCRHSSPSVETSLPIPKSRRTSSHAAASGSRSTGRGHESGRRPILPRQGCSPPPIHSTHPLSGYEWVSVLLPHRDPGASHPMGSGLLPDLPPVTGQQLLRQIIDLMLDLLPRDLLCLQGHGMLNSVDSSTGMLPRVPNQESLQAFSGNECVYQIAF